MIRITASLLFLGLAAFASTARAEISNCTNITSLPATISTQGVYCLKQDLSTSVTSGAAITINTNNVTIDCNDWKIGGLSAGAGTNAFGIHALNRKNITIRNCGIRGFRYGIHMEGIDSAYNLIEHNRIDLSSERGVLAYGDALTVRDNRIYDSGGRGNEEGHGITVVGSGSVVDNLVVGVDSTGSASAGILASASKGSMFVSGNSISGLRTDAWAYGVYIRNSAVARGNSVLQIGAPTNKYVGIECGSSGGIASDNVIGGFGTPGTPVSSNCAQSGNTTN